jgi:hypothetical protein
MQRRDRVLRVLVGLAVGLAVAGCASSADTAAPTSTTPVTTEPTATSASVTTTTSTPAARALGTVPPGGSPSDGDPSDGNDTSGDTGDDDPDSGDGSPHVPTALADLAPGDCIDLADLEAAGDLEVAEVSVLDCSEPHDAEVYALISLDDDPDSRHPGDEHVLAAADRVCLDAFQGYVGARYVDTRLEIVHLRPTVASWARGDRRVICAVVNAGSGPLVGSVAGAGAGAP